MHTSTVYMYVVVSALFSWARCFTFEVPLSTHDYQSVIKLCYDNPCNGLASHPGRVNKLGSYLVQHHTTELELINGPMAHKA